MSAISRRSAMHILASAMFVLPLLNSPTQAQDTGLTREMIFYNPDMPTGGNLKGDLTIAVYTDYNCPVCKRTAPIFNRVVHEDGKIHLVYKDWPIIRPSSVDAAIMALAAKYQGKYETAHHALMNIPGRDANKADMRLALRKAGIDMQRLDADADAYNADIIALIKRVASEAEALDLKGTPTFLIGPFMLPALDYQGFKQVISDARAKQNDMR